MPKMENARPMSAGGTVASAAVRAAIAQAASPNTADSTAPVLFARDQKMPAASGTRAATSVTVYAFCTMSYIVCFEFRAKTSAAAVNDTSTIRSVSRNCRSLILG